MLQRLADLRRRRADRAVEVLALKTQELRRAERLGDEAERAVDAHVDATRVREQLLRADLAGRTVRPSAVLAVAAELDAAAIETVRRREAVARAEAEIAACRSARAQSVQEFQARERARDKIDFANREETTRQARRDEALRESEGDDALKHAGRPS